MKKEQNKKLHNLTLVIMFLCTTIINCTQSPKKLTDYSGDNPGILTLLLYAHIMKKDNPKALTKPFFFMVNISETKKDSASKLREDIYLETLRVNIVESTDDSDIIRYNATMSEGGFKGIDGLSCEKSFRGPIENVTFCISKSRFQELADSHINEWNTLCINPEITRKHPGINGLIGLYGLPNHAESGDFYNLRMFKPHPLKQLPENLTQIRLKFTFQSFNENSEDLDGKQMIELFNKNAEQIELTCEQDINNPKHYALNAVVTKPRSGFFKRLFGG